MKIKTHTKAGWDPTGKNHNETVKKSAKKSAKATKKVEAPKPPEKFDTEDGLEMKAKTKVKAGIDGMYRPNHNQTAKPLKVKTKVKAGAEPAPIEAPNL